MSTTELLAEIDNLLAAEEKVLAALRSATRPVVDVRARNIRAHERYLQASCADTVSGARKTPFRKRNWRG